MDQAVSSVFFDFPFGDFLVADRVFGDSLSGAFFRGAFSVGRLFAASRRFDGCTRGASPGCFR